MDVHRIGDKLLQALRGEGEFPKVKGEEVHPWSVVASIEAVDMFRMRELGLVPREPRLADDILEYEREKTVALREADYLKRTLIDNMSARRALVAVLASGMPDSSLRGNQNLTAAQLLSALEHSGHSLGKRARTSTREKAELVRQLRTEVGGVEEQATQKREPATAIV